MEYESVRRSRLHKLHDAAKGGNTRLLSELLQTPKAHRSVDISSQGPDGKTALYHTVIGLHLDAVRILLSTDADLNVPSFISQYRDSTYGQLRACEETSLIAAARLGNRVLVGLLLQNGADPNVQVQCHSDHRDRTLPDRSALHFATINKDADMVITLLDHGANPNVKDGQSETALHLAARCNRVCESQCKILRLLCRSGVELDAANKLDNSAMYLAAFYGCSAKVEMLLTAGAAVDQCSQQESSYGSPLHVAAVKNRLELAELLIVRGRARLSVQNAHGCTPLMANINTHSKSDIAQVLLCHGADANEVHQNGYTVLGACIRNMRLDCEILSQLLVFAGCELKKEKWLEPLGDCIEDGEPEHDGVPPVSIAIPSGRVERLCDWLRSRRQSPHSLADLSRIGIRTLISQNVKGRSIAFSVKSLPLPTAMKDFILLGDICTIKV